MPRLIDARRYPLAWLLVYRLGNVPGLATAYDGIVGRLVAERMARGIPSPLG